MKQMLCVSVLRACVCPAQTPQLDDVLRSVEQNYPPLLAAFAERDIASANVMQAESRFDTQLGFDVGSAQFGKYPNQLLNFGATQNLAWQGASVYSGWSGGYGDFPSYKGSLDTRSAGDWSGGLQSALVAQSRDR